MMYFLSHFQGWILGNCLALHCTYTSAFLAKERPGFAALVGILVALCFDDVSLYVSVSFIDVIFVPFLCTFLLKLSKSVLKVEFSSLLCSAFCFV